ncbi:hypothetical protein F511_37723 [Dorcoceras hygrometricum]|uniref:Uncharacterized protein n=1 Tax=Dorcoceras hygrometricum TaxID=472368 RepID=A0A2Z7D0T6_9LAMI|nr:hypothetical protein F511_37723 [Dorcoceras hygrometricum]
MERRCLTLNSESDVARRKDEFSSKMQAAVFSDKMQKMDSAVEKISAVEQNKDKAVIRHLYVEQTDQIRSGCLSAGT